MRAPTKAPVVQSALFAALVLAWWTTRASHAGALDVDGRLLVWGGDAPLALRLYYIAWCVNVLLVDTRALPALSQAIVHFVSIGVAFGSGEFFHARLLTASHLLILDLCFGFSFARSNVLGHGFATLTDAQTRAFQERVAPILAWVTTLGCLAIAGAALLLGLDLHG